MTLSLHNPAELPLHDPVEERAARLLFSAGLGATTRAGCLLVALMRAAHEERVTIDDRTNFAAGCKMPESSLRSALVKLESLALVRTHRAGPREPLIVDLVTGPRPAALDPQPTLFPELAHVAEPPALRVAEDVVTCPACDVTAETGAGHVRAAQEVSSDDLAAMARRDRATRSRRADAAALPETPPTPPPKKSPQPQALTAEAIKAKYRHLCAGLDEENGTALAIPDSSSEARIDIPPPSAQQTAHVDVERRARLPPPSDAAGLLTWLVAKIKARVRVDPDFEWLPYSAALMAVDGPLSEHDLHECIAGCHGVGEKFTAALYRRLHNRAPPDLEKRTLLAPDGRAKYHAFGYLRRALRRYGVELDYDATQSPHQTQRKNHDQRHLHR